MKEQPRNAMTDSALDLGVCGSGPGVLALRAEHSPEITQPIGAATASLLRHMAQVIDVRKSRALLLAPQTFNALSHLHCLTALGFLSECHHRTLTTLLYPANRNSFSGIENILVDRDSLCKAILPPLNEIKVSETQPWASYVIALQTLKSLFEPSKRNARLIHDSTVDLALGHPRLSELFPHVIATPEGLSSYTHEFLQRLRRYAYNRAKDRNREAISLPKTPFVLIGLSPDLPTKETHGSNFSNLKRVPDLVLLDLMSKRRRAFREGWKTPIEELASFLVDSYVDKAPPILAVTDDPFVLQELRFQTLRDYDSVRDAEVSTKHPPVNGDVVLNVSSDIFANDAELPAAIPTVRCHIFGTDGLRAVEVGLRLRRKVLAKHESILADALGDACNILRRLLSLPGDPRLFHGFLQAHLQGVRLLKTSNKFDRFAARSAVSEAIAESDLANVATDVNPFLERFDQVIASLEHSHPGGTKFDGLLRRLANRRSDVLIILQSQQIAEFARWRLRNDPFLWDLRAWAESPLLTSFEEESFPLLFNEESRRYSEAVFFEPQVDTLLKTLCTSASFTTISIIANHANADQLARRLKIICDVASDVRISERLRPLADELQKSITSHLIDIDELDSVPNSPRSGIQDFTARYSGSGTSRLRILTLADGSRIKVFDGSEIPFVTDDAIWKWSKSMAKDLRAGDEICLFRDDLVSAARECLSLSAHATEFLETYHRTVLEAAQRLPGLTISDKASALRALMLQLDPEADLPAVSTVKKWLDLSDLLDLPRDEVRPHAPGKKEHYELLMRALKVPEFLSNLLWEDGVFGTRSKRIRHGNFMHQLLMASLIDPDAVRSRLPKLSHDDLWSLSELAEQYVETVLSNEALP